MTWKSWNWQRAYVRWIALAILALAIALIVVRWKLPMPVRRSRSGGRLEFWRNVWVAWRQRRRESAARNRGLRNLRGRKALLVGPERKFFRTMSWRLQSLRCAAHTAPTGVRGVSAAKKEYPDLIIVDALLPDMSAEDFLDSLGQTQIAVVFVGATVAQRESLCKQEDVACVGDSFDPDTVAVIAGQMLVQATTHSLGGRSSV